MKGPLSFDINNHRRRNALKVRGSEKVVHVAHAKVMDHTHFSLKPRPFCIYDTLSERFGHSCFNAAFSL